MGLFGDSTEEKEAKRLLKEKKDRETIERLREEHRMFLALKTGEQLWKILQEINGLREKQKQLEDRVESVNTTAIIGLFT